MFDVGCGCWMFCSPDSGVQRGESSIRWPPLPNPLLQRRRGSTARPLSIDLFRAQLKCSEREPSVPVLVLGLVGEAKRFATGHWIGHSQEQTIRSWPQAREHRPCLPESRRFTGLDAGQFPGRGPCGGEGARRIKCAEFNRPIVVERRDARVGDRERDGQFAPRERQVLPPRRAIRNPSAGPRGWLAPAPRRSSWCGTRPGRRATRRASRPHSVRTPGLLARSSVR